MTKSGKGYQARSFFVVTSTESEPPKLEKDSIEIPVTLPTLLGNTYSGLCGNRYPVDDIREFMEKRVQHGIRVEVEPFQLA